MSQEQRPATDRSSAPAQAEGPRFAPLYRQVKALITDRLQRADWKPGEPIPSAPARPTDPETSHAASKREPDLRRFGEFSHKARLLRVLSREPVTPLTAQEMALAVVGHAAPLSKIEGCRRRVSDLVKVEFIVDSGKRAENAGAGTDSILWHITDEGRQAIERLNETGWSL
jgi:hypothetical protein